MVFSPLAPVSVESASRGWLCTFNACGSRIVARGGADVRRSLGEALTMKYVLLGTLGPEWAGRHAERTDQAKAKLNELNIKLEAVYYTQGEVDFVDIVEV